MIDSFNQGLINFLNASPTPFHAVDYMVSELQDAGFEQLQEGDEWTLNPGGRYTRAMMTLHHH